jgi:endogenous inhibitor of DNA gyrase (YacG/DUF329 family)
MSKMVKCPTCEKKIAYDKSNPSRPFCSERCKLIDLGEWAEGKYALASNEPITEEDLTRIQNEQDKENYH